MSKSKTTTAGAVVVTGCRHQLTLPATSEACSEACGLGRLSVAQGATDIAKVCASCTFAVQTAAPTPAATGAAPAAAEPAPATEPAASAGSIVEAGFTALPSGLPREPIIKDGEVWNQSMPPLIDSPGQQRLAELKAAMEAPDDDGNVTPPSTSALPPFEQVLAAGCSWWAAGGSLMGWSRLKTAKMCRAMFFYQHVLGLERKPDNIIYQEQPDPSPKARERVPARELGTLVHACLEAFYRSGDFEQAYAPAEAVKGPYPRLALEARRLINFYMTRFNEEETREWDMRCVERESRYFFPARKVGGKRRRCCISAKLDGCYRQRRSGEGCLPAGERARDGLRIHEIKTVQYVGGRLRGFYQKAQLLQNLLCFNHGHLVSNRTGEVLAKSLAELVGDCWDVTVTHIGKAVKQDPNKDIERTTFAIPRERVVAFAEEIGDWYYEEILARLYSPHVADRTTWPRDWNCEDLIWPGWTCPYVTLCEANEADVELFYTRRPALLVDGVVTDALEMPKKLEKLTKTRKDVVTDNK